MIAYLKGKIKHKEANEVILDVGGVGYCARIPLSTFLKIGNPGETVELIIHTHMTDSALHLYGFCSTEEKSLFQKLISISGIGPKIALNILSGIEVSDLEDAIRQSDVSRISLVPGIGKKTAMRIAIELQEKLEKKAGVFDIQGLKEKEDLVSALMNLGFKRKEIELTIEETLKNSASPQDFESLLRDSLIRLAKI
ncbi:MAG: Holliday junction branch migration protein RuvA [Candidatus Aminicenantes bacterium]|nr:Holliday junction branch migration protein RuvA [Candidatus Aminicenantes bacterium]